MICVRAVVVKSIKSAMEPIFNLIQMLQNVVLHPNLVSASVLFVVSLINELFAVFPYNIILSGQLLFLEGSISIVVFAKLFFFVSVPVGVGTTLGSLPFYGLAYFGGKPAINKFGKYIKLSWEKVERVESKFKGLWYDEILFLALRSIPLLPSFPVNVAAGILRMRPAPYIVLTAVGTIIRITILFLFIGIGIEALTQ